MDNCPICGKPAVTADHDLADTDVAWISCSDVDCPLADGLPPDVWQELARAARLLASVEGLDKRMATITCGLLGDEWNVGFGSRVMVADTLADALIALAEQVKE